MENVFDVRAFGAEGTGESADTAAVQAAIDACSSAEGGRVYVSPGTYRCGTIGLKSGVELYLEAGATILGSPERGDYTAKYNAAYDVDVEGRQTSASHLICAVGASRIAIRGRGTIDGNGKAFFGPSQPDHPLKRFTILGWRPGHMLAFCECRDVVVEGVHLLNSPTYTIWPYACERVRIHGVTIRNPPETPNGDGIDPDCCKDVHISDCTIDTADDCIALYCGIPPGRRDVSEFACEGVTVTNCTLRSMVTGIRLGPHGDAPIRRCVFSNLVIGAKVGIGMHAYEDLGWKKGTLLATEHGPSIEDISFSNIAMKTECAPFRMEIHESAREPACIRNVRMADLSIETCSASNIGGSCKIPISDLFFSNVNLTVRGDLQADCFDEVPDPFQKLGGRQSRRIPHALFFRHVRGLRLHNLHVDWQQASGPWRNALFVDDVRELDLNGVALRQPPSADRGTAGIVLRDVRDASFLGCLAKGGTGTFVHICGGESSGVTAVGNDFSRAGKAFGLSCDLPADVLREEFNMLPRG